MVLYYCSMLCLYPQPEEPNGKGEDTENLLQSPSHDRNKTSTTDSKERKSKEQQEK